MPRSELLVISSGLHASNEMQQILSNRHRQQSLDRLEDSPKFVTLRESKSDSPQVLKKVQDLHQFCASMKFAPELLPFERLLGGWFGVAMEYFLDLARS
jgi:hypothetical protein